MHPAIQEVTRSIDRHSDRHEIMRACEQAKAAGVDLPEKLEMRVRERLDADKMLGRRRLMFVAASAVFCFAAIVAAIGLTSLHRYRVNNRDGQTLQAMIDDQSWDEAQAFFDSLDEKTLKDSSIVAQRRRLEEGLEAEESRQEKFQSLVDSIRDDPTGAVSQDDADELMMLSRSEEEKEIAEQMAARADQQRLDREAGHTKQKTESFESLRKEVDDFLQKDAKSDDTNAARRKASKLRSDLQRFVSENQITSPDLSDAAKAVSDMLDNVYDRFSKKDARGEAFEQITESVGQPDSFLAQLDLWLAGNPADPMAPVIASPEAIKNKIQSAERWIEVQKSSVYQDSASADSESSQQWLSRLAGAVETPGIGHPFAINVDRWQPYYESVLERGNAAQDIQAILAKPLMSDVYRYEHPKLGTFYSADNPGRATKTPHVVSIYKNLNLETESKNFGGDYARLVAPNAGPAPQWRWAKSMQSKFSRIDDRNFTPQVFKILSSLRNPTPAGQIDPILRLGLLRNLLGPAVKASLPIRTGFARQLEILDSRRDIWESDWIVPMGEGVAEKRNAANDFFAGQMDWDSSVKRMSDEFKRLRSPKRKPPRWIGWVTADSDGPWVLIKHPPLGGEVGTIEGTEKTMRWQPIAINDSTTFDAPVRIVDENVTVGMPVYWRPISEDGR